MLRLHFTPRPILDGIVFKNELTHFPLLEAYREGWKVSSDSGLTWWPSGPASRLVSLSNYCLWCVFSRFPEVELSLNYNSMRFKKSLDIFWRQIHWKKTFRRIFSYDFGCKKKAVSHFLASSSSWKRTNTGKPAWDINKLMLTWFMIFRDTLRSILVFVNENYCLCTCFTELYLFYWLLVVPLAIFIAAPTVFSR